MSHEDHDGEAMELVMPFVVTTSHGGPYEDVAFVAGYEAGRMDARLAAVAAAEGHSLTATVHTGLLPQLDLIAMRHGFTVESEASEEWPMWTTWTAVRSG